jgi:hypothetical protein
MTHENSHITSQLLIARDIIDMAREYSEDYDVLEYLSNFCFNLARIHTDTEPSMDWDEMFSILDQSYVNKDSSLLPRLDSIYKKVSAQLDNRLREEKQV